MKLVLTRALVSSACVSAAVLAGCIKPPEIVMVDRATALEQQASGSFEDVEARLDRASIEPRPVPLTPAQLAALGSGGGAAVDGADLTDADRLDGLLSQHCVGEGKDGAIVPTSDACHGAADAEVLEALVERVNRSRRQLWRWMHEQRADVPADELRLRWRKEHLRHVVCGGWIEADDGTWQEKAC